MNTLIERDSKLDHARMVIQEETLMFASRDVFVATSSPNNTIVFRLCLVHVKYFPENIYFSKILFSGKENIFKRLVVL